MSCQVKVIFLQLPEQLLGKLQGFETACRDGSSEKSTRRYLADQNFKLSIWMLEGRSLHCLNLAQLIAAPHKLVSGNTSYSWL